MTVSIDTERNVVLADRTVRRSGNSLVVSIPPQLLSAAGISEGDTVTISATLDASGQITLQKVIDGENVAEVEA
jgi:antitoxin component of MazEF toxin-antitoxin module